VEVGHWGTEQSTPVQSAWQTHEPLKQSPWPEHNPVVRNVSQQKMNKKMKKKKFRKLKNEKSE
jgi:hypothetical protein